MKNSAFVLRLALAMVSLLGQTAVARAADRPVAWVVVVDGRLEQQLNALAARGMRLAAVSDGLPQPVIAMQAPDGDAAQAEYRVVTDKDLPAALQPLVDEGFVPAAAAQRYNSRTQVIFERNGPARQRAKWRLVEFADLDQLEAALAGAAAEGFRARLLVQPVFKSWPGLSHRGLVLASKASDDAGRDVRVVINRSRSIDDATKAVEAAAASGFEVDLLFTSTRDGSPQGRRERLVVAMSRVRGATAAARPVKLGRASSFGIFGSGVPLGAAPHWTDDYVYAWSPAERRQTWATPIRLSDSEAKGFGLEFKLRIDGKDEETSDIVGLIARPLTTGHYELVILADQWVGPKPSR